MSPPHAAQSIFDLPFDSSWVGKYRFDAVDELTRLIQLNSYLVSHFLKSVMQLAST
jgi:hypothetical protein